MDLIGHCAVAEISGRFQESDIYGPRVVELMFLNYMHCHEWAYEHAWTADGFAGLESTLGLFRAHMICDWVIHYGEQANPGKKKRGWAYRKMMLAGRGRQDFFDEAMRRGCLLSTASPLTRLWDKRTRLDFDHSLVEFAVDLILAHRYITTERFDAIKEGLSRLSQSDGYGSSSWAFDLFARLNVVSDRTHEFLVTSVRRLGQDAIDSKSPEEFSVRTAIHKYNLASTQEAISHVRNTLDGIAAQLDESELMNLCESIANLIAQPSQC